MATGTRVDPYSGYTFTVEIDGITRAAFQECTGLDSSVEIKEYNEGGRNTPMKLAGLREVREHQPQVGSDRRPRTLPLAS